MKKRRKRKGKKFEKIHSKIYLTLVLKLSPPKLLYRVITLSNYFKGRGGK